MRTTCYTVLTSLATLVALFPATFARGEEPGDQAKLEFFEKKIRPVLVRECYECHSTDSKKVMGGLLLDSAAAVLKGGESGPAIIKGDANKSLLMAALKYSDFEMPPKAPLDKKVIADFATWINNGAFDPRNKPTTATTEVAERSDKSFWSFQPVARQPLPRVKDSNWPQGRIDHFVLHRVEAANLKPTDEADRRQFIRRVSYDLTGLPPTPEQVQTFVADDRPGACERLVDRLLASPAFGEQAARLWMDVARYAEDQAHVVGNNQKLFYPNAYLYRKWLIESFNNDLPYDEFITLQLAADLKDEADLASHTALGFLGLGPKYYRRNSPQVMADEWEDRVDTVARGLLGLTVACARCHDHKFDGIATADYYALAGVFASTEMYNRNLNTKQHQGGEAKNAKDALHIVREGKTQNLKIHIRGDATNLGDETPRRFLPLLCQETPTHFETGSGRLELAAEITDTKNPLTARVFVNRVWAKFFGRGIVATPSNFGWLGARPTHPELLNDLSFRFMQNDWSIKWLIREIATSATYRQSSFADERIVQADPQNQWLARMSRRRLSVESWRDGMLFSAGCLNRQIGGTSFDPQDPQERRRTVYSRVSRLDLNPLLAMFDFPDPNAHAGSRSQTTTPLQKLFVLNNPFVVNVAEQFVARIQREAKSTSQQIERAYEILYSRPPTAEERELGTAFLQQHEDEHEAWVRYAHVLLSANETLFVD